MRDRNVIGEFSVTRELIRYVLLSLIANTDNVECIVGILLLDQAVECSAVFDEAGNPFKPIVGDLIRQGEGNLEQVRVFRVDLVVVEHFRELDRSPVLQPYKYKVVPANIEEEEKQEDYGR